MIGIHETAAPMGMAVGSVFLGLAISIGLGYKGALQAWGLVCLAALILFIMFVKEPKQQKQNSSLDSNSKSDKSINTDKRVRSPPLWIIIALVVISGEETRSALGVLTPLTIFAKFNVGMEGLAFITGATSFAGIISSIASGKLSDKGCRLRTMTMLGLLNGLMMVGLAYAPAGPLFLLALLFRTFFTNGYIPVF